MYISMASQWPSLVRVFLQEAQTGISPARILTSASFLELYDEPFSLLSLIPLVQHLLDHEGQQIKVLPIYVLDDVVACAESHGLHGDSRVTASGDYDERRKWLL
jgi:hypothetical protein